MAGHCEDPRPMAPGILLCSLTPDGILFVIHEYPPGDFNAADIEKRPFQHFPIDNHPPPGTLEVPLLSFEFLLGTKLYAIQERDRGGERKKDAYDLALALPRASNPAILEKLTTYAAHRGRPGDHEEIARSAAAWIQHFATDGYGSLSRWLPNYVPDGNPKAIRAGLRDAFDALEDGLGGPIEPNEQERCRFLFQELSPADLNPIAKRLGFDGDPIKESENARDFVLQAAVEELPRPLPEDVETLRRALYRIES